MMDGMLLWLNGMMGLLQVWQMMVNEEMLLLGEGLLFKMEQRGELAKLKLIEGQEGEMVGGLTPLG